MSDVTLHLGDCLDVMRSMPDACVDAVVCDPPYGLSFMGREWDYGVPGVAFWTEALRVAKPGAHLLAFGGTRTYHRLACAIEDAGWQIKDCLSWLYGSGFPKHKSLLKPAWEPVVMAAKAGRRVVNIEECRIGTSKRVPSSNSTAPAILYGAASVRREDRSGLDANLGRWPANVCLDEEAAAALDEQSGVVKGATSTGKRAGTGYGRGFGSVARAPSYADSGGASRFFYVAKASRSEREAGLREAGLREAVVGSLAGGGATAHDPVSERFTTVARNTHPTVKPVALMRWLVRLVTPPDGVALDPFMGSGTTGVACVREGRSFVGIEREPEYHAIAEARIAHARGEVRPDAEQPGLDFGATA